TEARAFFESQKEGTDPPAFEKCDRRSFPTPLEELSNQLPLLASLLLTSCDAQEVPPSASSERHILTEAPIICSSAFFCGARTCLLYAVRLSAGSANDRSESFERHAACLHQQAYSDTCSKRLRGRLSCELIRVVYC
ncbi:MAG TPA: hypothetical protein VJU59_29715, partial [Paraburkholderia sp.]|uniref:hypothetical protein n=1 Tax=Paraburkholderia sp. TaxID=1926495 RepID=UPI002B491290